MKICSVSRILSLPCFFVLLLLCSLPSHISYAQLPIGAAAIVPYNPAQTLYHRSHAQENRNVSMWMDYVTVDGANNGYLWNFNNAYNSSDVGVSHAAVAFDILAGYTNYFSPQTSEVDYNDFGFSSPYPATLVMTIDSVWIFAAHENNSGLYDKIIVELIELDAQGELNGPVLWSVTDSTNQGISAGNDYLAPGAWFYLGYAPSLTTSPGQRLGLRFQYIDPTKSDSMAIYGGVRQVPGIGGISQPSSYPNSFVSFPYFWPGIQRNAQSIYPGTGQYFLAQNWGFWHRVLVDAVLPLPRENQLEEIAAFPNPTSDKLYFMWNKAAGKSLDIAIYNTSGQCLRAQRVMASSLSSDLIEFDVNGLAPGSYLMQLRSDKSSRNSRILIQP
ncbi:MAG: Secretion system C-terminal sorting domain [Bacteroidota bacterium]